LVIFCGPPTLTKPEEDCYSGGKSSTRSPFLFRLTRRLPLYSTIGGHPQGTDCAFSLGQESYIMFQNELVL